MAASLASIAETWPENVLTSIVSRKSHCVRKIIVRPFPLYGFTRFNGFLFDQADNLCNLFNP